MPKKIADKAPEATASDAPVENATEQEVALEVIDAVETDAGVTDAGATDAVDPIQIALSVRPAEHGLPAFPL
jgi:hypothetical protein